MSKDCACLHKVGLGFAFGAVSGLIALVIGLLAMTGYGDTYVKVMASVYLGYGASFWGAILGTIWAFGYGFVGGYVFAKLYNHCVRMCYSKKG